MQYISAAIRVLKHLHISGPLDTYNQWIRAYTRQAEATAPRTWEELSKKNKWLHWQVRRGENIMPA